MTSAKKEYVAIESVVHGMKHEYLFGSIDSEGKKVFLSLKKLSEKYNVSYNTLRKSYSTPQKWSQEKENVQDKISKKAIETSTQYEAEKVVLLDTKYESYFSELAKETIGDLRKKKESGKLRSIDFLNYANTLINCYEGEKVAHGESLEQNTSNGWDDFEKETA